MSRIDSTYFVRERSLPLSSAAAGVPAARTTNRDNVLQSFIDFYEPEFLKLILGDDLYEEYIAAPTSEKWTAFDSMMFNETLHDSPVADYIYCKYQTNKDTVAEDGTLLVNGDDAKRVPVTVRTIPVWNAMVRKLLPVFTYLTENYTTFCTTYEYNVEGWGMFAWWNGCEFTSRPQNGFGL